MCWRTPRAGALLVLVHSSCRCSLRAWTLLMLVHSSCWCTPRAGALVVPVRLMCTMHSLCWCSPLCTVYWAGGAAYRYTQYVVHPVQCLATNAGSSSPPRPGPTGPPYSPTVDYLGSGCRWAALRMDSFPSDGFHSGLDSSFIVGSQVPQGEGQQELPPGSGPVRAWIRCLGPGTILPWTRACRHSLGMAC